eukprot:TRINITY_DN4147_c0_g1_i1.p1 TRINITY_DN4147_c0_g1~~TRINITY_DN4147_c0_g1_i1.p1  ORF type:complete len:417 (+),score=58.16 TRINITY_DN4147_c0_g1_i1:39-1289(+)
MAGVPRPPRAFGIVLWGATGFTGKLVAEYLAKNAPRSLKWAVAGRDAARLRAVCASLEAQGYSSPAVLIADALSKTSLDSITATTDVVLSTVGPYAKYGLPLVQSCAENGTHYVDLTGEALFIRKSIDLYHETAAANGAKIVHCCGFDSIPSDLGALLVQDYLRGTHNVACGRVEYVVTKAKGGISGGTIASVFNMLESGLADLRRTNNPYFLNPKGSAAGADKIDRSKWFHYDGNLHKWVIPGMMAAINNKVVRRSAAILGYGPEFSYDEFTAVPNVVVAFLITIVTRVAMVLLLIPPVRNLIRGFLPKPGQGPSPQSMRDGFCNIKIIAKSATQPGKPHVQAVAEFGCKGDPGYSQTAVMIAESALCLALQPDALPARFGVLTPATALGNVLVERLRQAGMTLEINESEDRKRN